MTEIRNGSGEYPKAEIIVKNTRFLQVVERDVFGDKKLLTHRIIRMANSAPRHQKVWEPGEDSNGVKYRIRWFAIRPETDSFDSSNIRFVVEEMPMPFIFRKKFGLDDDDNKCVKSVLDEDIFEACEFSVRTRKILREHSISTPRDLLAIRATVIQRWKGVGDTTWLELRLKLGMLGFFWGKAPKEGGVFLCSKCNVYRPLEYQIEKNCSICSNK